MRIDNFKTFAKYTAIITFGVFLQFSADELSALLNGLTDALCAVWRWSPAAAAYYDEDAGAGQVLYAAIAMPFMLALLYVMWLRGVLAHADAVRRAEIVKRFTDFRFLYLIALLRRHTPPSPNQDQRITHNYPCDRLQ